MLVPLLTKPESTVASRVASGILRFRSIARPLPVSPTRDERVFPHEIRGVNDAAVLASFARVLGPSARQSDHCIRERHAIISLL